MLSIRNNPVRAPRTTQRAPAPRRMLAPARATNNSGGGGLAEALNSVADAFVKIFSPPKDDAPNGDWAGTGSSFSGRISRGRGGRPFRDGFDGSKAAAGAAGAPAAAAAAPAPSVAEGSLDESVGYMEGAVRSVMDRNFDGREDDARPSTGAQGWKGDLHGRKRDGFHLPRGH